jgi:hypothetical protein
MSDLKEKELYCATAKNYNYKAIWLIKSIDGGVVEVYNITSNTTMRKNYFELMVYFDLQPISNN